MYTYSKPVSSIRSANFVEFVHDYETVLVGTGYNPHVVRFRLHTVAHFGVWRELEGVGLAAIDQGTVEEVFKSKTSSSRGLGPRNYLE